MLGGTVLFFAAFLRVAADAETQLSLLVIKGTGRSPDETRLRHSVVQLKPSSGGVVACLSVGPFFQHSCLTPPLPTPNRKVQMPPSGERSWNMHIFNRLSIWIGWAALFLCAAPTGMPLSSYTLVRRQSVRRGIYPPAPIKDMVPFTLYGSQSNSPQAIPWFL